MPQLSKTLEYRRARWLAGEQNFENHVRQAWARFPTQVERAIIRRDGAAVTGARCRDDASRGFAVHCVRYVDRQGVGTIPMLPANEIDLGERQPDENENFLNAGFVALIRRNDVICLDCGRNAGSLRNYFVELFRKAGMSEESRQFELARIGNPNRLALIERIGVRSIDLTVDISSATAENITESAGGVGIWESFRRGVGSTINALTARDDDLTDLRRSERGTVKMSINVKRGDLEIVKHSLDRLAGDVSEDDEAENFVINLRDNKTRITPSDMSIRKGVRLEAQANSVSVTQAWDAMGQYLTELDANGEIQI